MRWRTAGELPLQIPSLLSSCQRSECIFSPHSQSLISCSHLFFLFSLFVGLSATLKARQIIPTSASPTARAQIFKATLTMLLVPSRLSLLKLDMHPNIQLISGFLNEQDDMPTFFFFLPPRSGLDEG